MSITDAQDNYNALINKRDSILRQLKAAEEQLEEAILHDSGDLPSEHGWYVDQEDRVLKHDDLLGWHDGWGNGLFDPDYRWSVAFPLVRLVKENQA